MKQTKFFIILVFAVLFPGLAMTADFPQTKDEAKASMKKDKTGTNPINFTNDARIYHEFSNLETSGDGEQSVTTLEFRIPFNDRKWQFRTRLRVNSLEVDTNNDGVNDVDDTGIGVVDMRLLTVPYLNMKKKMGIAAGLELFLPTGNAVTGSQTTSLGPQVFGVFFLPFGISNSIVAPAVQYRFSVDEEQGADEVEQFLFDIFFLKTFGNKQFWLFINPQYVIDQEQDVEFGFLDVELGMMLDKYLGTKGNSIWVRPSIGWGTDKVTESGFEVGYKVVW